MFDNLDARSDVLLTDPSALDEFHAKVRDIRIKWEFEISTPYKFLEQVGSLVPCGIEFLYVINSRLAGCEAVKARREFRGNRRIHFTNQNPPN